MIGAAGVVVYYTAKASAKIVQGNEKRFQIEPIIKNKIVSYFPTIDLSKVQIIRNATIPANWFTHPKHTEGRTFGQNIYLKEKKNQFFKAAFYIVFICSFFRCRGSNRK